jgi:hypothetical protein
LKKSIIIIIVLFLSGFAADLLAEEDTKTPEPPMISAEDQETAETIEMLELMEILEEMEILREYHLFAEEETDEKED